MRYLFLVIFFPIVLNAKGRNELNRFVLLRDKILLEQILKQNRPLSYLDIDFHGTSGLKSMIGDLKNSTNNSKLDAFNKQSSIIQMLDKLVNTEKYIDLDLWASIPFGKYSYGNLVFYPSIFASMDFAANFSVSNAGDPANPILQTYLRLDQKLGFWAKILLSETTYLHGKFYQLARRDNYSLYNAAAIINEGSGNILGTNNLNQVDTFAMLDLLYSKKFIDQKINLEIQELQLINNVYNGKEFYYPNFPFWHMSYEFYYTLKGGGTLTLLGGVHNRQRYSLLNGTYFGLKIKTLESPFQFLGIVDSNFITLNPKIILPYFSLNYTIKLPIYNPQQYYWVGVIHGINLSLLY